VRPNAPRTRVRELASGVAVIDVAAPPQKGKANQELLGYLAKSLGVAKSRLEIVRGETSKRKWVRVPLHSDELWRRLEGLR